VNRAKPTDLSQRFDAGRPLDPSVRARFEAGFGVDFSAVRVHADAQAADTACDLDAQAFTIGTELHFGAGCYRPDTHTGRELIGHELAHVVQQSRGGAATDAESRADSAARGVLRGQTVSPEAVGGAPPSVQLKPNDESEAADTGLSFPTATLEKFALNSADLTSAHAKAIDTLAASIAMHVGIRVNGHATIAVVGHTDRSGDESINQTLGHRRADAVKQALTDALIARGVDPSKFSEIAATSMGESSPVVPTPDGIRNEKNRRVEISVRITAVQPPAPPPTFDPRKPLPPAIFNPPIGQGPRRDPADDLWRRMEENQRKIDEFDKKHPRTNRSLSEAVIDKVMEDVIDPLIRKLPVSKELRDLAHSGVRKGLEKGSEAACDVAVDASGATGSEADAIKSACKAALKTKLGESGGGSR
jgi:outer membrane protein OmpA-like peptidoglycan-associated protein